jgi:transposase
MKRSTAAAAGPALQEAERKAVRTALQAGVSPGQVAKHFGISLAAVRQVLTQAEER